LSNPSKNIFQESAAIMDDKEKPIEIKQPPVLFSQTQAVIAQASRLLGGPLVTYWNSQRGSVCSNDVVALYNMLEKLGTHETIYLFIKSGGGNGQESLRMVSLLRQYCKNLITLVPLECASAATMIALGANQIQMGPTAYLTAVDTSLHHALSPLDRDNDRVSVSLDELNRVIRLWRAQEPTLQENPYKSLFAYVHPLVIGAVDRAESLSVMLCRELLKFHISDEETIQQVAAALNSKYPSHNYPILLDEARAIGLSAVPLPREINTLLLELNRLYSEMGQKASTDFDETRAHSNEILNIHESADLQIYFQQDKDWFYRSEERRWITLNDNSGWRQIQRVNGKMKKSVMHIT
jgi:hypothetical protein